MANASNFLEASLLNHVLRNASYSKPSNIYLALTSGVLDDSQTGSTIPEVVGTNYSRLANSSGNILWSTPSAAGTTFNMSALTWPQAGSNWGLVSGVCVTDASTAGNLLVHGVLSIGRTVLSGDTFVIQSGNLNISCL